MANENLSQQEIEALLQGVGDLAEDASEETPSFAAVVKEENPSGIESAHFEELGTAHSSDPVVSDMGVLMDIPLTLSVELGKARCYVKDLLSLTVGSIVELDRLAGDPVDILINGKLFAKGEVVVIDENFGIRIKEILGSQGSKNR